MMQKQKEQIFEIISYKTNNKKPIISKKLELELELEKKISNKQIAVNIIAAITAATIVI